MDAPSFRRMFQYDSWANQQVLSALEAVAEPPAQSIRLFAHVLGAGTTWLSRLTAENSPLAIWPELTLVECSPLTHELSEKWQKYLENLTPEGLGESVSYTNSKGEGFSTLVVDVLLQVLMHSTYHRGQIATDMRANGHQPALTDFIIASRLGKVNTV